MCNSSDQSCPKVTSGGSGGGGGGGAVGQQDLFIFLLLQPLRPPPQYFFFPPATSTTTTAPPFQHRLETTSRQLVGTNSSNNSSSSRTSSDVRFVHGARYLQNLYPFYCYCRNGHGIRKQPQLCYPVIMNPTSYAMASAAELNKKRLRPVDGDQNGIVHIDSANTNAVYPNSLLPNPSASSPATINFAESLSSSLGLGPGPGGGLYCTNMLTGSKRKRDDNMDRFESKESTDIDLELKL